MRHETACQRRRARGLLRLLSVGPRAVTAPEPAQHGTEYLVVIGVFTLAAFAVIAVFAWLEQRREREYLETIRAYLEHGQAPPPELVRGPMPGRTTRIRRGLLAVAVGAALVVIFA